MENRNKKIKKTMALFITLILIFSTGCFGKGNYEGPMEEVGAKFVETLPQLQCGSIGGEWAVIGLAQSPLGVEKGDYKEYLSKVEEHVKAKDGVLNTRTGYKYTEYSRIILGVTAAGGDVTHIGGYNFLEKLTSMENVCKQGINGPIWALIAYDSALYPIPDGNVPKEDQTTRERLIMAILDGQLKDGGWDIMDAEADPDMTAMALTSLAPYYREEEDLVKEVDPKVLVKVKKGVERGLNILEKIQLPEGGFQSWETESSESCAQVVVALSALGIDCREDPRFKKKGGSLLEALLKFYDGEGNFSHTIEEGPNPMATEQAFYALVAYDRFLKGEERLYDFR